MKRVWSTLIFMLCAVVAAPAMCQNLSGSIDVSVVVVPPASERVEAPAPSMGFQRMQNDSGSHWIVEASANDAIYAYTSQLQAAGFHPINGSRTQWSDGRTAVLVSAKDAVSSKPISRLSVLAYDIQRQNARMASSRTTQLASPTPAQSPGLLAYN